MSNLLLFLDYLSLYFFSPFDRVGCEITSSSSAHSTSVSFIPPLKAFEGLLCVLSRPPSHDPRDTPEIRRRSRRDGPIAEVGPRRGFPAVADPLGQSGEVNCPSLFGFAFYTVGNSRFAKLWRKNIEERPKKRPRNPSILGRRGPAFSSSFLCEEQRSFDCPTHTSPARAASDNPARDTPPREDQTQTTGHDRRPGLQTLHLLKHSLRHG